MLHGVALEIDRLKRPDASIGRGGRISCSTDFLYQTRGRQAAEQPVVRRTLQKAERSVNRPIGLKGVQQGRPVISIVVNPPKRCCKLWHENSLIR